MNRLGVVVLVLVLTGCGAVTSDMWEWCESLCQEREVGAVWLGVLQPDCCYCKDGARYTQ